MEKENYKLEYKETISKGYLKTVSAFANYNDGEIIFGITDDYKIKGIKNPEEECLNIENQINDSISPRPDFSLFVNKDNTIVLKVMRGEATPYKYQNKAYKRSDTSTVEVDKTEEKRLILYGLNLNFEDLTTNDKNLSFNYLGKKLKEIINLNSFNIDTLKSLNLYSDKIGYNNAASLLSDKNNFPGLDIIIFGASINIIKKRFCLAGESILKQYFDALEIFKDEYEIEQIEGGLRKEKELIPFEAFREALANSLVHRIWDININSKIEMYMDKVIISSPGGLSTNMTIDDYINGNYSYLRNPTIANVFRRLNIIEAFATGIKRINYSYKDKLVKPIFKVTSSAISVTLPTIEQNNLNESEKQLISVLKPNCTYSRMEIQKITNFNKDKLLRTLNSLIDKGIIRRYGKGKSITYIKNN